MANDEHFPDKGQPSDDLFKGIIRHDKVLGQLSKEVRRLIELENTLYSSIEKLYDDIKTYAIHHRLSDSKELELSIVKSSGALGDFLIGLLEPLKDDLYASMDIALEILSNLDDNRVEYINSSYRQSIIHYLDIDAIKDNGIAKIHDNTITTFLALIDDVTRQYREYLANDINHIEHTEWPND